MAGATHTSHLAGRTARRTFVVGGGFGAEGAPLLETIASTTREATGALGRTPRETTPSASGGARTPA